VIPLLLVTSNRTVRKRFAAADRSRTFELIVKDGAFLKNGVKSIEDRTLCYVDVADLGANVRTSIRSLCRQPYLRIGVIDREGSVSDVAELFHLGAVDYLGPTPLKSEIPTKRLKTALELKPIDRETMSRQRRPRRRPEWIVSGRDWKGIKSGYEYTFVLLYVELDLIDEWKQKSGKDHLGEVMSAFHAHVEKMTAPLGGRVWMWTETGGLVLFPFGGTSCPQIELCMKTVIDRRIISVEQYSYNSLITYKMALHIGNTLYQKRGNTGTLISDTVNFTFHLGQKFLGTGEFCLTEPVEQFLSEGLKDCFAPAGEFEHTAIYRMKLPV